jgi:hypothetical protein
MPGAPVQRLRHQHAALLDGVGAQLAPAPPAASAAGTSALPRAGAPARASLPQHDADESVHESARRALQASG